MPFILCKLAFCPFELEPKNLLSNQSRHTYLSLLLASVPSLEYSNLDGEAKRMLTEAAKTRDVALEM